MQPRGLRPRCRDWLPHAPLALPHAVLVTPGVPTLPQGQGEPGSGLPPGRARRSAVGEALAGRQPAQRGDSWADRATLKIAEECEGPAGARSSRRERLGGTRGPRGLAATTAAAAGGSDVGSRQPGAVGGTARPPSHRRPRGEQGKTPPGRAQLQGRGDPVRVLCREGRVCMSLHPVAGCLVSERGARCQSRVPGVIAGCPASCWAVQP